MGWQVVSQVVLHAGNTIINPDGIFSYAPSPGAGNLISSDVGAIPASGADEFGNVIPATGYVNYQNNGASGFSAVNIGDGTINWFTAATEAGPWTQLNTIGFNFVGANGTIVLQATHLVVSTTDTQLINGVLTIPTTDPVITTLPDDANSGSTWVSGERAFMNNNWVANINNNFSNIVTALRNVGIFV